MSQSKKYISSEEYRQKLVEDGERRYQEWHTRYMAHLQSLRQEAKTNTKEQLSLSKPHLTSEEYRQRLVKDGERRYQEWHTKYLAYQKKFLSSLKP